MATQTTVSTPQAFHPDIVAIPPQDAVPDSVLVRGTYHAAVVSGDQHYARIPFVKHSTPAQFVAEGSEIDESDPDTMELIVSTGKLCLLDLLSREQAAQPNGLGLEIFRTSAAREIAARADRLLLWQPQPTGGSIWPPAGILMQQHTEGTAITSTLDPLADAVAVIETGGGTANLVITSPAAWAALSKIKAANDSAASLLGAGTAAAARALLGLPVLVTPAAIPDDEGDSHPVLVVDTQGILAAYSSIEFAASDDYAFNKDAKAIRTSIRFGAVVSDPSRVVELGITV